MARRGFGTYALMVSVVLWGVLLGGVVYAHVVFFPPYLSHLPESAEIINGPFPVDDARFWMLIHPVLILSLIVSLVSNWRDRGRRRLIAIPFGVYLLVMVATLIYFVPELMAFKTSAGSTISGAEWLTRGNRWQYLSWARGVIMFVSIVPLLLALMRSPYGMSNDQN